MIDFENDVLVLESMHYDDFQVTRRADDNVAIEWRCRVAVQVPDSASSSASSSSQNCCCWATLCGTAQQDDPICVLDVTNTSRTNLGRLNAALFEFLRCERAESAFDAIVFVEQHAHEFMTLDDDAHEPGGARRRQLRHRREAVYFHHLYSTVKRRKIVSFAQERSLNGFSVAGKPGMLLVEGEHDSVVDFVRLVRNLAWQKMSTRAAEVTDNVESVDALNALNRCDRFAELSLAAHGARSNHASLADVKSYMAERHIDSEVFELLFPSQLVGAM
jgi:Small nuclear ribonucleoprotein Prp3, C-terminal domain